MGLALGACTGHARVATSASAPASGPGLARDSVVASRIPSPIVGALSTPNADPFPSTYTPPATRPTVIRNVTLITAAGPTIARGAVLLRDGRIAEITTRGVSHPPQSIEIDGTGMVLTPGLVDVHAHAGVFAAPSAAATSDGNEMTDPSTPQVWAEHSVWPQDPHFPRLLAGGVTTLQVVPGSANLFAGRTVVLKVVPSPTVQGMKFPGARYGLKMACGENPKRAYAQRGLSTRMGNVAGYRTELARADGYRRRWDAWLATRQGDPPPRDLGLETLAEVLRGNIFVHVHCYRADDMAQLLDVAREFGVTIRAFHHAIEAYKIPELLAARGTAAAVWPDHGFYSLETIDVVPAQAALLERSGVRVMLHSDDPSTGERLTHEAAKVMAAAARGGIPIEPERAIRWLTIEPARVLGLDDRIGSIEVGKAADLVLWSGDPFDIYTHVEKVWVDGMLRFDRSDHAARWRTDFELGIVPYAPDGQ